MQNKVTLGCPHGRSIGILSDGPGVWQYLTRFERCILVIARRSIVLKASIALGLHMLQADNDWWMCDHLTWMLKIAANLNISRVSLPSFVWKNVWHGCVLCMPGELLQVNYNACEGEVLLGNLCASSSGRSKHQACKGSPCLLSRYLGWD